MAEQSTQQQYIYRLSALDQSVTRKYITVALIFPCHDSKKNIKQISDRFISTVKKTISYLPVLAGTVRPATDGDGANRGHLEVAVSLDKIKSFEVTVQDLTGAESNWGYEELRDKRLPACELETMQLAPLQQKPASNGGRAFAAQLNIIPGGVIAVFQLHHAVADLNAIQAIVGVCSTDDEPAVVSHHRVSAHAVGLSAARGHLSDAAGVAAAPATAAPTPQAGLELGEGEALAKTTCVLGFNAKLINKTMGEINARFIGADFVRRTSDVVAHQVLAAILWRGVIRARMTASQLNVDQNANVGQSNPISHAIMPIDVRARMRPELPANYFGNAIASARTNESIVSLGMPMNISSLQYTASLVRNAMGEVADHAVRRAIASAKQSDYRPRNITTAARAAANGLTDVVITDWAHVIPKPAHLTLGLGEPTFVRKLSGGKNADEGCIVHAPPADEEAPWEVTITLCEPAMDALLADEGFMKFVDFADGEKYVNGVTENENIGHQILVQDEAERREQVKGWRAGYGHGPWFEDLADLGQGIGQNMEAMSLGQGDLGNLGQNMPPSSTQSMPPPNIQNTLPLSVQNPLPQTIQMMPTSVGQSMGQSMWANVPPPPNMAQNFQIPPPHMHNMLPTNMNMPDPLLLPSMQIVPPPYTGHGMPTNMGYGMSANMPPYNMAPPNMQMMPHQPNMGQQNMGQPNMPLPIIQVTPPAEELQNQGQQHMGQQYMPPQTIPQNHGHQNQGAQHMGQQIQGQQIQGQQIQGQQIQGQQIQGQVQVPVMWAGMMPPSFGMQ